MRILVTNDDGVQSDGLFALKEALKEIGDVTVVAPDSPQSACGHSITLHKPLRMDKVRLRDGSPAFASNGTPSDCANLGILEAMHDDVDIVVAGINHGPNLGWDIHYSGTVSAAVEASVLGKQAIAVSIASWDDEICWQTAADFAVKVVDRIAKQPLPPFRVLNVNVPNVRSADLRGVRITSQGRRQYVDRMHQRTDPRGKTYYWLSGSLAEEAALAAPGSDVRAVAESFISITPLQFDATAWELVDSLASLQNTIIKAPDSRPAGCLAE
jgi:5'-nucleotidase